MVQFDWSKIRDFFFDLPSLYERSLPCMDIIKKYFPGLSSAQLGKLEQMFALYNEWNKKINVISRKDMDFFYLRHVLHSMSILKVVDFLPGTDILDVGTGGGFPGIPLAICCPDANFLLIDSVGKKIKVVNDVTIKLGLSNVNTKTVRAEDLRGRFDFITSRAVKALPVFMQWVKDKVKSGNRHTIKNGVLYLKGGDMDDELGLIDWDYQVFDLSGVFVEPYFSTKKIVHITK